MARNEPAAQQDPPERARLSNPEHWLDAYGDYLFRYAHRRLSDRHLAEEAVQETLKAALQARERFSGRSSERTYLVAILRRKVVDIIRRVSRERPAVDPRAAPDPLAGRLDPRGHWTADPADWSANPERLLERKEFRQVLQRCIDGLPPQMGRAFVLRRFEEMTSEEICKVMDVTATNLWVILHRARARLRECLEAKWFGRAEREGE